MPSSDRGRQAAPGHLSGEEALRRMHRVTSDRGRPFEGKLGDLLALGCTYLGVEVGFLTEISDGEQLVVEVRGEHERLQPGNTCPISRAYCRRTVEREDALTVQHAAVEGWEGDAAYERFGLESYIGAKVVVEGDVYGTFCFADTEPRDQPFTPHEETFVELMAEWVSYELFQKRAAERIQRQRDQLAEFVAVVSHDLRNPLGIAQGYLELAEESGDPESFEQCRRALTRMESLVDDLLVLARDGDTIAETEYIGLVDLVEACWSFVDTREATLVNEADRVIVGDRSRLQQLFENLFRNAVEHGSTSSRAKPDDAVEHAGSDVTVRVGLLADGTGVFVEDDGPGIPESNRDRVFDDGYSTRAGGTGFGLTIVRRIVDAHGWDVTVSESATGGARFEISNVEFHVA